MSYRLRSTYCALAIIAFTANLALAQDEAAGAKKPPKREYRPQLQTRIFQLKHVHATQALMIVSNLNNDANSTVRVAVDSNSNSLIAAGTDDELAAIEELLVQLDAPRNPEPKRETIVLKLKHISPVDAAKTVTSAFRQADIAVQPHVETNQLVISGSSEDVAQVIKLAETLDTKDASSAQSKQTMLRVVWLMDGRMYEGLKAEVPENLRGPIEKLTKKAGIGELKMVSQMFINVGQARAGKFGSTMALDLGPDVQFQVAGNFDSKSGDLEIEISADLKSEKPWLSISTSVNPQPGRPIILGMSSAGDIPNLFALEIISLDDSDKRPKDGVEKTLKDNDDKRPKK